MENQLEEAIKLLRMSKCPDPDCDNNEHIAVQINDDEWEAQQCQWCCEKRILLEKFDYKLT